jgi:SAM-dependent methyltransferase
MLPPKVDLPYFFKKYSNESHDNSFFYKGLKMFSAPGTHEAVIQAVNKYLKPGSRVMDLGAGTGAFSQRIKDQGYQAAASGINPAIFAVDDVPYILWDFDENVPLEHRGIYDAVVAIEVIEHLENIFDFFRKVHRLLKPGGLAFITTPNILEARSRLMFLTSGNFLLFQKNYAEIWGHIQIVPYWLLQYAADCAELTCLELYGISDLVDIVAKDWKRDIVRIFIWLKKLFYKEKFPGELSKVSIIVILQKSN